MSPMAVGLIVLGLPLLLLGMLLFGRWRPIFLFYLALLVVGLGYLSTTDTPAEIGVLAMEKVGMAGPPKVAPAKPSTEPARPATPASPVRTIPTEPPAPAPAPK